MAAKLKKLRLYERLADDRLIKSDSYSMKSIPAHSSRARMPINISQTDSADEILQQMTDSSNGFGEDAKKSEKRIRQSVLSSVCVICPYCVVLLLCIPVLPTLTFSRAEEMGSELSFALLTARCRENAHLKVRPLNKLSGWPAIAAAAAVVTPASTICSWPPFGSLAPSALGLP